MMIGRRELLSIVLARSRKWGRGVGQDLLLGICLLCGGPARDDAALCTGCRTELPRIDPACSVCAEPLPVVAVYGHCQQKPPPYDRALAALRGHNEAVELARPISRRLGIPLDLDCCRRLRATAAQSQKIDTLKTLFPANFSGNVPVLVSMDRVVDGGSAISAV